MRTPNNRLSRLPLWCMVLWALGLPRLGSAEWLVTIDGARIETAGPWTVRAEVVVFHSARGVLSSIRSSAIDLQASRRSSRPAAPVIPLEPLRPTPVMVLTDRDIARGPHGAEGSARRGGSGPSGKVKRYTVDDLVVDRWTRERQREVDGFEIAGDLRNATGHRFHSLGMQVVVFDAFGAKLGTEEVFLMATALEPGEHSGFRVTLSDVHDFAAIRFLPFGAAE